LVHARAGIRRLDTPDVEIWYNTLVCGVVKQDQRVCGVVAATHLGRGAVLGKIGNHDIYHAPDDFFALYLDCRANRGDWWWGIEKYKGPDVCPTEKRVIDTVKWVIKKYDIDENRVYLCGNSMGGSGTLGIGMRHGDVFAAIKANVPARVEHVSDRMYFPPRTVPADVTLPDPPIVKAFGTEDDVHHPSGSDGGRQLAQAAEAASRPGRSGALDDRRDQRTGPGRPHGLHHHSRTKDHR
jgi:hypothetical protein